MLDEGGAIRKDRWIPVIKKESHDSNRGFLYLVAVLRRIYSRIKERAVDICCRHPDFLGMGEKGSFRSFYSTIAFTM